MRWPPRSESSYEPLKVYACSYSRDRGKSAVREPLLPVPFASVVRAGTGKPAA